MMKKSLRSVSFFCAFALILTMNPITAFAIDDPASTVPIVADGDDPDPAKHDIVYEGDLYVRDAEGAVRATDEGSVTVTGSVSYQSTGGTGVAVTADNGGEVSVGTGVGSTKDGILATGDGSNVIITGILEADATGITASNDSVVSVTGDITQSTDGIRASQGAAVFVGGSVNASHIGVVASNDATVFVDKDINAENGVHITDSFVKVEGNINAEEAVAMLSRGGELQVKGDASAEYYGVAFDMQNPAVSDYAVLIDGTLSVEDDYAIYVLPPQSQQVAVSQLEIVLYKINAPEGKAVGVATYDDNSDVVTAVKNAINYIIRYSDADNAGTLSGYDDEYEFLGYKTMKQNGSVNVSVRPDYYIQGSSAISIVQNADGTYTVRLKEGCFGGIDIQVLKKAIEDATGSDVVIEDDDDHDPAPGNVETPAPGIVVTYAGEKAPISVEGAAAPARTISFRVSDVTPAQMKAAVMENITKTPEGGVLRIETDKDACFDRAMLQAFAEKGNIDIELIFTYRGQKMRIVIPRGTDINKLLDEKGYAGYLRLAAILGFQVI